MACSVLRIGNHKVSLFAQPAGTAFIDAMIREKNRSHTSYNRFRVVFDNMGVGVSTRTLPNSLEEESKKG
eukprot:588209-Hanusia_phi.AAC.1